MEKIIDGYRTKYFHICAASRGIIDNMRKDGVPVSTQKAFAKMEDEFLKMEIIAVCAKKRGFDGFAIDALRKAKRLSRDIKKQFSKFSDFKYHKFHLNQIESPHKVINPATHRSPACPKILNRMLY